MCVCERERESRLVAGDNRRGGDAGETDDRALLIIAKEVQQQKLREGRLGSIFVKR